MTRNERLQGSPLARELAIPGEADASTTTGSAGAGKRVGAAAGLPARADGDWAMADETRAFIEALGRHRNWDPASDPSVI